MPLIVPDDKAPAAPAAPPSPATIPSRFPRLQALQKARASLSVAETVKPDDHAKALQIGDRMGVPAEAGAAVIRTDPAKAQALAKDRDGLIRRFPNLARWMGNPDHAAIGQDDVPALAKVAEHSNPRDIFGTNLPEVFARAAQRPDPIGVGVANTQAGFVHAAVARGLMSPEDGARKVAELKRRVAELGKREGESTRAFKEEISVAGPGEGRPPLTLDQLGLIGSQRREAALISLFGGQRIDTTSEPLTVAGAAQTAADVVAAAARHPGGALYTTAENLPFAAPALTLGLAGALSPVPGGFAAGTFAGSYLAEYGGWIDQRLGERQVDQTDEAALLAAYRDPAFMEQASAEANRKALGTAGIDALFSFLAGRKVAAAIGGTGAGKVAKTVVAGVKEVGEQMAGEAASEAAGQLAARGKIDVADVVLEGLLAGPQGAAEVGIGTLGRLSGASHEAVHGAVDGAKAVVDAARDTQAAKAVKGSKVTTRRPEAIRALVEPEAAVAPRTRSVPVEAWDAHWQALGKSPVEAAKRVTGSPSAYQDARATGSLAIPYSRYIEALANDPDVKALQPQVVTRPGGVAPIEADAKLAELQAEMDTAAKGAEEAAAATPAPEDVGADETRAAELVSTLGLPPDGDLLFQSGKPESSEDPVLAERISDAEREAADEKNPPEVRAAGRAEAEALRAGKSSEEADAAAVEAHAEGGSKPASQAASQGNDASQALRAVADAIEAVPASGIAAKVGQFLTGSQPVAEAVSKALPGEATAPLAAAAQRDPAGTAAALRELADIRDRQAVQQGQEIVLRRKLEAAIRAAGRPAKEAGAVARVLSAFVTTMKARFPEVPAATWDALMVRFAKGEAPADALMQGPTLTTEQAREWAAGVKERLGLEDFQMFLKGADLKLDYIIVPREMRKQGVGSRAMNELTAFADAHGLRLTLSVAQRDDAHGTTSRGRLVSFYKRFGFVENKGRNKDFRISEGMFREPRDSRPLAQGERGAYSRLTRTVHLFETANETTLTHEASHWMVDVIRTLAADPAAPDGLRHMWADLAKEAGADPGAADLTPAQHEHIAEAFVGYVFKGEAPSAGLRRAFATMRAVLLSVYEAVKQYIGADKVSPELRDLFDRMLATDAEIDAATAEASLQPLFPTEAELRTAGVDPKVAEAYTAKVRAARDVAVERLTREVMRDIEADQKAKRAARLAELRAETAAAVEQLPASRALKALQVGPAKLSRAEAEDVFVDAPNVVTRLNKLGLLLGGKGTEDEGMPLQVAAEAFGFTSGTDLVDGLLLASNPERLIEKVATDRLQRESPDLLANKEKLRAEARAAVLTQQREEVLSAELRMLVGVAGRESRERTRGTKEAMQAGVEAGAAAAAKELAVQKAALAAALEGRETGRAEGSAPVKELQRRVAAAERKLAAEKAAAAIDLTATLPSAADVRARAVAILSRKAVRDIKPSAYLAAVTRAGLDAKQHFRAGNTADVIKAKKTQQMNLALYREALSMREQAMSHAKRLGTMSKDSVQETIGKAGPTHVAAMNKLLSSFSFRMGSLAAADRATARAFSLQAYVAEQQALSQTGQGTIAPDLLAALVERADEPAPADWRNLTLAELSELRDSADQLLHIARKKNQLRLAQEERDLAAVVDPARAQIQKKPARVSETETPTRMDRTREFASGFSAMLAPIDSLARRMDGDEAGGPVREALVVAKNAAQGAEVQMGVEAAREWRERNRIFTLRERIKLSLPVAVAGMPRRISGENVMMIGAYWGSPEGRDRLFNTFTREQVETALSTLTDKQVEWLNRTWAADEARWPLLRALSERLYGWAPPKVQALAYTITRADGTTATLTGGHTKLKYAGQRADEHSEADIAALMRGGAYGVHRPKSGSLKERLTHFDEKLRLDFGVLAEATTEDIHLLSHMEPLKQLDRTLSRLYPDIVEHWGKPFAQQFRKAYDDMARGTIGATGVLQRSVGYLRTGTVVTRVGFNLAMATMNLTDIPAAWTRVGPDWMARGLAHMFESHESVGAVCDFVNDSDARMANRGKTMQRELHEANEQLRPTARNIATRASFLYMGVSQYIVDRIVWIGSYEKQLAAGKSHVEAVDLAYQDVIDTQGSGLIGDMPAVMREGGEFQKLFTTFMGFATRKINLTAEAGARLRTNWRNPAEAARFGISMLLLWWLPAAIAYIAYPRGDDDDDPLVGIGREAVAQGVSGIPLLREVSGIVRGFTNYHGSPGESFFYEFTQLGVQAMQGEADDAAIRSTLNVVSILTHLPLNRALESYRGLEAYMDGEASPLAIVGMGGKK